MKIKNRNIHNVVNVLMSLGNRQSDIILKWEFSKRIKPLYDYDLMLQEEVNNLIKEKGEEKDGRITIPLNHPDYVRLMEYENNIDIPMFTVEELAPYDPTVQELVQLEAVINE